MSASLRPAASGTARIVCALISLATIGCGGGWHGHLARVVGHHWPDASATGPLPADLERAVQPDALDETVDPRSHAEPQTAENGLAVLGREGWVRAIWSDEQLAAGEPTYRWRYPELEKLLAGTPAPASAGDENPPPYGQAGHANDPPMGKHPDLRRALASHDPIVSANAAICLARLGDASGIRQLAAAVANPRLKLHTRLAATEALGSLREPSPAGPLIKLLDQYGHQASGGAAYMPELHAELIRALARHVDPAADRRFVEALRSPAPEVRLEAIRAWAAGARGTLPPIALDLRTDPDARVRMAALTALARRRHPQAYQHLSAALHDQNLQVRIAAVTALGELGGAEARAVLERLLENEAELIRAAAVSALAALGAEQVVMDAAADQSWRVRLAVARALVHYPNRKGAALARDLLDDRSSSVQGEVIRATVNWPLRQAGPILLEAMDKTGYMTRRMAAEQLAEAWPPAAEFPIDAAAERRAEVLERLHYRFSHEIGFVDRDPLLRAASAVTGASISPEKVAEAAALVRQLSEAGLPPSARSQAIQTLVAFGPELIQTLEQLALVRQQALPELVYREVLPRCNPVFEALDRLTSRQVAVRRRAAGDLVELAGRRPLERLALARLASVAITEPDSLVWQSVLTAVAADPSEPSIRLAYAAIGHPSPEVRRRACEHLAAHADAKHAAVLLPALEDESDSVRCAAVRALGAARRLDNTGPLKRLLASPSSALRVEAATALARLGDPSGAAALERLAYSNDQTVRRQVAVAMGQFPDPSFIPTLVRMLDDRQSIRQAALQSLPKVVGYDVAEAQTGPNPHFAQRIELWKRWFERQQSSASIR